MKNMKSKNKILSVIIILSFIFTFFACIGEIKSPVFPTWETEFRLPLLDRSETLAEIVKDEKNIFVDSVAMLLRFDSTTTKSTTLNEMFKNDVKYDNHSVIKINSVNYIKFGILAFEDSVNLEEAKIYYGALNYTVTNHLDKPISAKFIVPGFKKNNTDTLKFEISVNPKDSGTKKIDLKNYHYKMLPEYPNGIRIEGEATIGDNYSGDSITFDLKLDSLAFNYLKGKTKPYFTKIDQKTTYLDLDKDIKDILPKVDVRGAKVYLSTNLSFNNNIEARLKNFQVLGIFKNGSSPKKLKINGKEILDTIITLNKTQILSVDNFAINEFLSPQVPDSITYMGELVFNPGNKVMEISIPDTVFYTYKLEVLSICKLDNFTRTDTSDIKALDKDQKENLDKVIGGEITIEIDNPFPIGFELVGYLTDSSFNKLIYVTREKGDGSLGDTTFSLIPAPIDASGEVTGPAANQKKFFKISKDEIQKVKEVRHLIFHVIANSTNKKMVYIRPKMRYNVRAYGQFQINVDTEKK